jgi:multidrug efflux pump
VTLASTLRPTAVFAGMIGVTAFGIFLTPLFYYVIQGVTNWFWPRETEPESP